jgi:hypothetical protein
LTIVPKKCFKSEEKKSFEKDKTWRYQDVPVFSTENFEFNSTIKNDNANYKDISNNSIKSYAGTYVPM